MGDRDDAPAQTLSLPEGGGSFQGIGESFHPDLFSGTGNFSVPLVLPGGRLSMTPHLALSYSSGAGNSAFGLGWDVGVASITRKTSAGVPLYDDDTDVFVLTGADDLVPVATDDGGRITYRPRTETEFARIVHAGTGSRDVWDVWSRNGVRHRYGGRGAVLADPADPDRRFRWCLRRNVIDYRYQLDQGELSGQRWRQLYLREIRYADYGDRAHRKYLVVVRFSYATARPDPFTSGRAGFPVRTRKRCRRIDVLTRPGTRDEAVFRTYHLTYTDRGPSSARVSLLTGVGMSATVDESRRTRHP